MLNETQRPCNFVHISGDVIFSCLLQLLYGNLCWSSMHISIACACGLSRLRPNSVFFSVNLPSRFCFLLLHFRATSMLMSSRVEHLLSFHTAAAAFCRQYFYIYIHFFNREDCVSILLCRTQANCYCLSSLSVNSPIVQYELNNIWVTETTCKFRRISKTSH